MRIMLFIMITPIPYGIFVITNLNMYNNFIITIYDMT